MPQRRNEQQTLTRQEPFAYACEYSNGYPIYEAWADVGSSFTDAKWIVCKHSYDGSNNLIRTQWATDSNNRCGDFTNVIGASNTSANLLSTLSYA